MSQPFTDDLQAPFDPTGYLTLSGAQLLQLVSGLYPNIDTGFVKITIDSGVTPNVPDANATTKWQRYVWIRITATNAIAYIWNPTTTSDPTLLNWVTLAQGSIGIGTITGDMIADNTIPDEKIISVSWGKLIGIPSGFSPSGAAGGDLSGTYPNPSIADSAVVSAKITDSAVTNEKIANSTIDPTAKLSVSNSAYSQLRINLAATAWEVFTPSAITLSTALSPSGNANKIVKVNSGATDFELVTFNSQLPSGLVPVSGDDGKLVQINTGSTGYNKVSASDIVNSGLVSGSGVFYKSSPVALSNGLNSTIAHGLGATPRYFDVYIYVNTAIAGLSVGQVLKKESVNFRQTVGASTFYVPSLMIWADATNVYVTCQTSSTANDTYIGVMVDPTYPTSSALRPIGTGAGITIANLSWFVVAQK